MDISEMDISEMTSSNVSEIHRFPICPFPISLFSDKPPFLPAPELDGMFARFNECKPSQKKNSMLKRKFNFIVIKFRYVKFVLIEILGVYVKIQYPFKSGGAFYPPTNLTDTYKI
jgi:hypothetical protein